MEACVSQPRAYVVATLSVIAIGLRLALLGGRYELAAQGHLHTPAVIFSSAKSASLWLVMSSLVLL